MIKKIRLDSPCYLCIASGLPPLAPPPPHSVIYYEIQCGVENQSLSSTTMPVKFTIATHKAESIPLYVPPLQGPDQLLDHTWARKAKTLKCVELLQSSFSKSSGTPPDSFAGIRAQHNGFVNSVTQAYNGHQHLILRPDDVWIAVLGQLNF